MSKAAQKKRGDFFRIDPERAIAAANAGLYQGLAYLVLASGTGPENRITSWSTTANAKHLGIGVSRARENLDALRAHGFIGWADGHSRARPRYELLGLGERQAFLPRSIVEGAGGEAPLLRRIRETGDKHVLMLLLALYAEQDLARNAGVSRAIVSRPHGRKVLARAGAVDVCGFFQGREIVRVPPLLSAKAINCGAWLRDALETLRDIRAIEWVDYLWDSDEPDAEPVLPLSGEVGSAVRAWAMDQCLDLVRQVSADKFADLDCAAVVPTPRHWRRAALVSVIRMTHCADTANAARFVARDLELADAFRQQIEGLRRSSKEGRAASGGL